MKKRITHKWTDIEIDALRKHYSVPQGIDKLLELFPYRTRASFHIQAVRLKIPHYMYLLRGEKNKLTASPKWTIPLLKLNTVENPKTGCWIWQGSKIPEGYGTICFNHKTFLIHRIFASLAFKKSIDGKNVNHHCDTPSCVNPAHLYIGTQSQNIRDCVERKRHRWNKRHDFQRQDV